MNTVFMNYKNSKTSDPHRLFPNLTDKISWNRSDKCVAFSNLSMDYTWKKIKKPYKNNKFEIPDQKWNEDFELFDGSFLYHILKIILNIS